MKTHKYGQLNFDKSVWTYHWRKRNISISSSGTYAKKEEEEEGEEEEGRRKRRGGVAAHIKIKSKQIIDLNVKYKAIRLLKENMKKCLCDLIIIRERILRYDKKA